MVVIRNIASLKNLGFDRRGHPFCTKFVAARDVDDHVRFAPLQTAFAQDLLQEFGLPYDLSTAVLFEQHGEQVYTQSNSILRLLPFLGFPYTVIGRILLLIPLVVRDLGYRLFARNRGRIWKGVKRVTGVGDTNLSACRDRIVGLDDVPEIPESWGLSGEETEKQDEKKK